MENSRASIFVRNLESSLEFIRFKDQLTTITVALMSAAVLLQLIALGTIFITRLVFGSHFNQDVYSKYQGEKADSSMKDTLRLREAEKARDAAKTMAPDSVTIETEKALGEVDQIKTRQHEDDVLREENEKKAKLMVYEAGIHWKYEQYDLAFLQLQAALKIVPDYIPAIVKLAEYWELSKDLGQAQFQLQRAASLAKPDSSEMKEILSNLDRVTRLIGTKKTSLFASEPARTDLPLGNEYDLRFNLDVKLNTRIGDNQLDVNHLLVEVTFWDQSITSDGVIIPIKAAIPERYKPKDDATLTLYYPIPHGYFRKKMQEYGQTYGFCGYTIKVFYHGIFRESYSCPESILAKYASANS